MRVGVSRVVFVACGVDVLLVGGNDERSQNDQRARGGKYAIETLHERWFIGKVR